MRNLRCGLIEGLAELRILMAKSKTIVLLLALATVIMGYTHPLGAVAGLTEEGIGAAEPFILLMNTGYGFGSPHFFIYLFFSIILSDLPSFTNGFRYRMVRMSKVSWWIGQLTVAVVFTLFYMAFVVVVTILPAIGRMSLNGEWSQAMQMVGDRTDLPQEITSVLRLYTSDEFMDKYSVGTAFWLTAWYAGAYLLTSALFISAFHAMFPKLRPVAVGILIVVYLMVDVITFGFPYNLYGLSLAILSQLSSINYDFNRLYSAPSLQFATTVWGCLICAMIAYLYAAARRIGFEIVPDKEG